MKYTDIHCHLDFADFDADREMVLTRMKEKEVAAIAIGVDLESSKKSVEIAKANENIWATIGIHPGEVNNSSRTSLNVREVEMNSPSELFKNDFEKLIKSSKVVAIGECGLEYFYINKEKTGEAQKKLFVDQIEFAVKHNKPLMLHVRPSQGTQDAYEDALEILGNYKKEFGEKLRGNVHFFAGDVSIAKKFLDLGFTMSFTGVITFLPSRSPAKAGTHDYDEVIKYLPQNSIMSETDAPFVAPVPYRGKRCEPIYVIEIVKKMAEIRGENADVLNKAIISNSSRLFNIFS